MITPRIRNNSGPLLLENVVLPINKISQGVYRVFTPDGTIPLKLPWDDYAVPQGYGHFNGRIFYSGESIAFGY